LPVLSGGAALNLFAAEAEPCADTSSVYEFFAGKGRKEGDFHRKTGSFLHRLDSYPFQSALGMRMGVSGACPQDVIALSS
jgi:hypothetical protein